MGGATSFSCRPPGMGSGSSGAHESDSVQVLDGQPQCRRSPSSTSGWRRAGNVGWSREPWRFRWSWLAAFCVRACALALCSSVALQGGFWYRVHGGNVAQGENTLQLGRFVPGHKLGELGGKAAQIRKTEWGSLDLCCDGRARSAIRTRWPRQSHGMADCSPAGWACTSSLGRLAAGSQNDAEVHFELVPYDPFPWPAPALQSSRCSERHLFQTAQLCLCQDKGFTVLPPWRVSAELPPSPEVSWKTETPRT